ncbi:FtsX-like permease family protein [Pasteuria penetrans]|uniref:FtsX-like permease family protein n=1 Tax=Pasteuria penetrans TaxID=86005 RepID=UPI000FAED609|nr:ABC transporter permease [Pasteuria penetrans]
MTFFWCICRAIVRRPQAYIGLLWSEVTALAIVFSYATLFFHPQLQVIKEGMEPLFNFLLMPSIIIHLVSVPVYYSLVTLYRTRQRQFGVFFLLGMSSRCLWVMLLLEVAIVGCCAVVLGVLVGMMLSPGLLSLAEHTLKLAELKLPFYFSWKALTLTTTPLLLLILAPAFTHPLIQRKNVVQLLQSERRLDARPKLPMNILYSIAAILSLGSLVAIGFFLPVPVDPVWGICVYYAIFLLSALSMYSLYRQSSLALFHFCRWNKNFSWKNTRLLWIGNMAHRFHDNSRFFYNLSFLALFFFFITSIFIASTQLPTGEIVKNMVENSQRTESALVVYRLGKEGKINPNEKGNLESINQQLLNNGLIRVDSYPLMIGDYVDNKDEYLSIQDEKRWLLQAGGNQATLEEHTRGWFLSLENYNEMLKASGKPFLSLGPNEAAALCEKENCPNEEIYLNPIPEKFGVKRVRYLKPTGLLVPLQRTQYAPQWILGSQVYARVLQYPNVQRFWDVNYLLPPYHKMNPRLLKTLVKAKSVDPKNQILHRNEESSKAPYPFIHSEVANTYQQTLFGVFYLLSIFLGCPTSLIGIMNMFFLRVYNDVENQRRQFQTLLRIGAPIHRLQRSISIQVASLFFIPMFISGVLALYWIYYMTRALESHSPAETGVGSALLSSTGWTFSIFLVIQIIVFLPTRSWVLRTVKGGNKKCE